MIQDDGNMIQEIIEESERDGNEKNDCKFRVTERELEIFVGIIFYSGLIQLSAQRLFWSTSLLYSFPIVSNQMSRNRFEVSAGMSYDGIPQIFINLNRR